jgi:hypothetical protein
MNKKELTLAIQLLEERIEANKENNQNYMNDLETVKK